MIHRYRSGFWWARAGRWSLAYDPEGDDGWRPLSERYGTTRTWWLWRMSLRRHGHLTPATEEPTDV